MRVDVKVKMHSELCESCREDQVEAYVTHNDTHDMNELIKVGLCNRCLDKLQRLVNKHLNEMV